MATISNLKMGEVFKMKGDSYQYATIAVTKGILWWKRTYQLDLYHCLPTATGWYIVDTGKAIEKAFGYSVLNKVIEMYRVYKITH